MSRHFYFKIPFSLFLPLNKPCNAKNIFPLDLHDSVFFSFANLKQKSPD